MTKGQKLEFRTDISDVELFDAGISSDEILAGEVTFVDERYSPYANLEVSKWVAIKESIFEYPVSFFK
ncbi:hypothetical protein NCTGTJJY_CDS0078 [Serratia phage 92A1]|nr:hypothetical protein NCTGTJJY_CDS0078 [Serratia phage 92A1]